MFSDRIVCWEALDISDPFFSSAQRLYEQTQHPDEAIPWGWIARSVKGRCSWRPGAWGRHLVLATADGVRDPDALAGFAYGMHLPGYGGYVCYLGVDELHRKRGVGTRLFEMTFRLMAADAASTAESLPFVVWESHKPGPKGTDADWKLWDARVNLFDRVGGLWIDGIELQTPNYTDPEGPPVPLELFLRPMEVPASEFDAVRLQAVAAGLLEQIYKTQPGDRLYDRTLPPGIQPRLRPAREAGQRKVASRQLLTV